jgi:TM2 domain-containing membrane protein YozV
LRNRKTKGITMLLAFFLGGVGVHRFYLGRVTSGLLYLLFSWTFIPASLALLEIIRLAFMDREVFDLKYNRLPDQVHYHQH